MNRVDPIVTLNDVQVRIGSQVILSHINWELKAAENWAVLGGNGAGKTTFLRLIRGDIHPAPKKGTRTYCLNGSRTTGTIAFRSNTGTVSSDLLDQYRTMGWNIKGIEVILSGLWGTTYVHQPPDSSQMERTNSLIDIFDLSRIVHQPILTLSQGEAKRILIARALVNKPRLLIFDEICENLDRDSRQCVIDTIQETVETGTQMLYATHMTDDLIPAVSHIVQLEAGRITAQGTREKIGSDTNKPIVVQREPRENGIRTGGRQRDDGNFFIRIRKTDAYLGGKKILHDLNWTIGPGENWAVFGQNGSGKTTLLKLLIGDLNPRFGGTIHRFGDDIPKNIWEIRRRISLVSADLQAIHMSSQTGLQTVLSGFFGSVGFHNTPTQRQLKAAGNWMSFLGLDSLADQRVRTLSYGQFRMLLIARAVVNDPDILLLDEPTAGLDRSAAQAILSLINNLADHGTCIVHVTHRAERMPDCITNIAVMQRGSFTFQGSRGNFHSSQHCSHRLV